MCAYASRAKVMILLRTDLALPRTVFSRQVRWGGGDRHTLKHREPVFKLRAAGLFFAQIGKKLDMSRQRAQKALSLHGNTRFVPIRCRECGDELVVE